MGCREDLTQSNNSSKVNRNIAERSIISLICEVIGRPTTSAPRTVSLPCKGPALSVPKGGPGGDGRSPGARTTRIPGPFLNQAHFGAFAHPKSIVTPRSGKNPGIVGARIAVLSTADTAGSPAMGSKER